MRPGQGRVFPDMRQVEGRLEKGNLSVRLHANLFAYMRTFSRILKKVFFPGVLVAKYGYATDGAYEANNANGESLLVLNTDGAQTKTTCLPKIPIERTLQRTFAT